MPVVWTSVRFSVAYAIFFVTLVEQYKRCSVSLALVAMTASHDDNATINNANSSGKYSTRLGIIASNSSELNDMPADSNVPLYQWDLQSSANIYGAFYYGYFVSNLFSGVAMNKYGARLCIGVSELLTGCLQFLFPWATTFGPEFVVALRAVDGLVSGFFFAGTCSLLGTWSLPEERGKISFITQSACWLGNMFGFYFTGYISDTFLGWPFAFYFAGIFTLLADVAWFFWGYNSPDVHPRITAKEKKFFQLKLNSTGCPGTIDLLNNTEATESTRGKVPWKKILSNKAVIALIIIQTFYNWGYYFLVALLPQYLHDVHSIDILKNGLINCLPYAFGLIGSLVTGHALDAFVSRKVMTVTSTKKLYIWIYSLGLSFCFFGIGLWGNHMSLVLYTLAFGGLMLGVGLVTFVSLFPDISPSFAGEIGAISNAVGNLPALLAPLVNAAILQKNIPSTGWKYSFLLTSAVTLLGSVLFSILGSARVQPWDKNYFTKTATYEDA